LIAEINEKLHIHLPTDESETLNDLILQILDHPPAKGETVRIDHFELSVQETSLLGAKTVLLRTVN
ncbi:MAG TPA: transporter associated domain-containing protein, partial [Chlamydiales bacterium]|nr:transporter associated domain-containing protein [Chlamydiales bacterium]